MNTESKESKNDVKKTVGCKKCGCRGWRPDSSAPDRCVNIRVPTSALCGHTKADHD